ncbi:MAG: nicotinate-nucleotide--dimethylbenzimidazole phosphoribosyltransferase [Treponema sp.]|nr:nicotinate-nucleotide--dimethylbenzimidazole phosphoribosyltransferase [Treponema sp.]
MTTFSIQKPDEAFRALAFSRWNSIAKPLGSLGLLEKAVCDIAAMQRRAVPDIAHRALAVFCADNGIVAEGVSQTDSSVTAVVAKNLCTGDTSVCKMARYAYCDVFPVDMGMNTAVIHQNMTDLHVVRGTRDFLLEDAMTRAQAEQAVKNGASFAHALVAKGYTLLATGEMGIGNTTTSSALVSVLLNLSPEAVTGAGAGLSRAGVLHKTFVIESAIRKRMPASGDIWDVLSKVGGLDIAGMAGFMLGAAEAQVPVIVDGFISAVAALVAYRINPAVRGYLLASHASGESASSFVLKELQLDAPVHAGMRLGEGTGCMTLLPLLDMALAVFTEMATFEDIHIEAYKAL